MGDNGVMQRQSEKKSIAYSFLEQSGNKDVVVATDILKFSSGDTSQVMQTLNLRQGDDEQELAVPEVANSPNQML